MWSLRPATKYVSISTRSRSTAAPEHLERAGLRERVIQPDVDEVAVQPGCQPDRVLVPVEDVERGRRLAEQVVVDDVVPHEVVGAQPREHARERLAVEVALAGGLGDRRGGDVASAERRKRALAVVVKRAHHQRQARDPVELAVGGKPRRRRPAVTIPPEQAAARWTCVGGGDRGNGVARLRDRLVRTCRGRSGPAPARDCARRSRTPAGPGRRSARSCCARERCRGRSTC